MLTVSVFLMRALVLILLPVYNNHNFVYTHMLLLCVFTSDVARIMRQKWHGVRVHEIRQKSQKFQ